MNQSTKDKIKELQLRRLASQGRMLSKGNGEVPSKKKSKPLPYKMQNTFEKSLRGVPGGHWLDQATNPKTGCKVGPEIGLLRSARNANTTQGSYVTTRIVGETDNQGRKAFGR